MRPVKPLIIGIAGGTGSGKSTIAKNIAAGVPGDQVTIIDHDAYYRHHPELTSNERGELNFDHPDALETSLLVSHLVQLKKGEPAELPLYDFKTHSRLAETRRVQPTPIIIVEGILVFVDRALLDQLDVKIFVDTDPDIRVFRRIRRDIEQRGRTFQAVREQYYRTVRPMHLEFVEPSKRWADLIIPEGGGNRVALDLVIGKLQNVLAQR
jgi:uridine kinase